ncbi:MAG: hypothetical protein ACO2OR_01800 [Desulfurococcaceae archaeon]
MIENIRLSVSPRFTAVATLLFALLIIATQTPFIVVGGSNSTTVVGSSDYTSPQEVIYWGPIVIEKYVFNGLTLAVLSLNPVVYFEYRNVYVVPFNDTRYVRYEILRVRGATYSQLISSRLDQLRRLLNDSEFSADSIQVEDNIIYIDLSKVSTSRVVSSARLAFSGIGGVIVICDERFIDIVTRQFEYRALLDKLGFSSEIEDLLVRRLSGDLIDVGLFSMIGGPGSTSTPIGKWFRSLAHIKLTGSYSEARDIIEGYVRELAEIARRYVPEDVPLYVLVTEYSEPVTLLPLPLPPDDVNRIYGTPLENTNTTSPDYSETLQSSQLNSLFWVAPIIAVAITLAALYVTKRPSPTSM